MVWRVLKGAIVGSEKGDITCGVGIGEEFSMKVTFEMALDELVGF